MTECLGAIMKPKKNAAHISRIESDVGIVLITKGAHTAATELGAPPPPSNISSLASNKKAENNYEARTTVGGDDFNNHADPYLSILNDNDDPPIVSLETDQVINLLKVYQFETKAFRKNP
jgi:hypothetical protein